MNSATHQSIFGRPKVRKTWKHTLSPEKNQARLAQMRFMKQVRKLLGEDFSVEFHFNTGGPAVWGETYVNIYTRNNAGAIPVHFQPKTLPVVEACLSAEFSYIRQWDGRGSGRNVATDYKNTADPQIFAVQVKTLAARPFVRF